VEASDPDARETLRRLEQRLEQASDAAEQLLAEAAQSAARGTSGAAEDPKPPPAGWQAPEEDGHQAEGEFELLAQLIQVLRELIPAELERRLAAALRELLLAVRALIDWYIDRLERRPAEPTEIQDIPIL
jgi:hypothetical protein